MLSLRSLQSSFAAHLFEDELESIIPWIRSDGIDPVAIRSIEHRSGGRFDSLYADFIAGEFGLGQLDQFGRAVAD